MSLAGFRRG